MTGELPDAVTACVGGGSNAMGIFSGFIQDEDVALFGVEPSGRSLKLGDHACSLPVYSIASGLDYPGSGPEHCMLKDSGRVTYTTANDKECLEAFYKLCRLEGIIPALESSHAVAFGMKFAKEHPQKSILVNLSGRGDKDIDFVVDNYGCGDEYFA